MLLQQPDFFNLKVASFNQQSILKGFADSRDKTEKLLIEKSSKRLKEDDTDDDGQDNDIDKDGASSDDDGASSSVISSSVDDCLSPARHVEALKQIRDRKPVRPEFALSKL